MEEILSKIDYDIKNDPEIIAAAIIEGEDKIVYTTDNWEISADLNQIRSVWGSKNERYLYISGNKYVILQNTIERLIAVSLSKTKKKIVSQESIVGFKDNERMIICKIPKDPSGQHIILAVPKTAEIIRELTSKKPYLVKEEQKEIQEKEADLTPKILSKTSNILERLGLRSIGLSEADAKVYLSLLRKGVKGEKVGILDRELELKRTHIYRIIERLTEKGWVEKSTILPESAQHFSARPLSDMIEKIVKEKEDELRIIKGIRLILSETPENGWHIISSADKDLKMQFDIDIYEIIGFEKDCGIVIFEYDRIIKDEENLDRVKLRLYTEKLKIRIIDHPDLDQVKVTESTIKNYLGAEIVIKFKEGSNSAKNLGNDFITIIKLVTIPIDNKIYVIWGSKEKFTLLVNMIMKIG